jgi:hypothetical protein
LFLPDDYVFAFRVGCFALLVGGDEILDAGLVGDIAGARDFDGGGVKAQAGTRHRQHSCPTLANIFLPFYRWTLGRHLHGLIGVEGDGLFNILRGGGLAPRSGSGADGGFVGCAGLLDFLLVFGLGVFFNGLVAGRAEDHGEKRDWQDETCPRHGKPPV